MATQNPMMETFEAGADLSSHQFKFVKLSSGKVILCSAAGDDSIGILQNNPTLGQPATVAYYGKSKVKMAGALAVDSLVKSDANGLGAVAVKANGAGITGSNVMGTLTKASGGANEIAEIFLRPMGAVPTTLG